MTNRQQQIVNNVEAVKQLIIDSERWLWAHPQTGFTEWEANAYLTEQFEALGYTLTQAGNIPGFYTDIDTGKPGPTLVIMGELDALDIANHPESVNGMTHCCGHHAQAATLLGIAAALKQPGALDGMCGKIRLMTVPAEEMIQLGFREQLRKDGTITFFAGKIELMKRGFFDGVDIAVMVHGNNLDPKDNIDFACTAGNNGCIMKTLKFKGKSAHAGGAPHLGVNAQYAAMLGMQAANNIRETFQEKDKIRFHPVAMGVNCAVNIIPDELVLESHVRAKTLAAIEIENKKLNRAMAGAALSMGAGVEISDRPGHSPAFHDPALMKLAEKCCGDLVGADRVSFDYDAWMTGTTDFGDVTQIMPGVQFFTSGEAGIVHGIDFQVIDVEKLCVNSAKAQLFVADALLSNDAETAKEIIANYKPAFPSAQALIETCSRLTMDKDAVVYDDEGNATVDFQNL